MRIDKLLDSINSVNKMIDSYCKIINYKLVDFDKNEVDNIWHLSYNEILYNYNVFTYNMLLSRMQYVEPVTKILAVLNESRYVLATLFSKTDIFEGFNERKEIISLFIKQDNERELKVIDAIESILYDDNLENENYNQIKAILNAFGYPDSKLDKETNVKSVLQLLLNGDKRFVSYEYDRLMSIKDAKVDNETLEEEKVATEDIENELSEELSDSSEELSDSNDELSDYNDESINLSESSNDYDNDDTDTIIEELNNINEEEQENDDFEDFDDYDDYDDYEDENKESIFSKIKKVFKRKKEKKSKVLPIALALLSPKKKKTKKKSLTKKIFEKAKLLFKKKDKKNDEVDLFLENELREFEDEDINVNEVINDELNKQLDDLADFSDVPEVDIDSQLDEEILSEISSSEKNAKKRGIFAEAFGMAHDVRRGYTLDQLREKYLTSEITTDPESEEEFDLFETIDREINNEISTETTNVDVETKEEMESTNEEEKIDERLIVNDSKTTEEKLESLYIANLEIGNLIRKLDTYSLRKDAYRRMKRYSKNTRDELSMYRELRNKIINSLPTSEIEKLIREEMMYASQYENGAEENSDTYFEDLSKELTKRR